MATEPEVPAWLSCPAEPWPPDDTEESILGTDLHQTAIRNLVLGINGAARVSRESEQPAPWRALTQELLLGCRRPEGSYYRVYPDVFVYRQAIDPLRGSHSIEVDGPPALIIEVLSDTTFEGDIDLVRGKGYSYARAGVGEYLVLDPAGQYLREGIRAWRLVEDAYRPWEVAADGRYHSQSMPMAFTLAGMMPQVYLADGRRMHLEDEVEEAITHRDAEIGRRDAEIDRRDAEIDRRDAEIARLRRMLEDR
jgi:hypothetical protein